MHWIKGGPSREYTRVLQGLSCRLRPSPAGTRPKAREHLEGLRQTLPSGGYESACGFAQLWSEGAGLRVRFVTEDGKVVGEGSEDQEIRRATLYV